MVNNFTKVKSILDFQSWDDFYFLQLIKRKKDLPDIGSNNVTVGLYYIRSLEYLDKAERDIINICDATGARAYIHLAKRSFKKVGLLALNIMSTKIINNEFVSMSTSFATACGKVKPEEKLFLIDVDDFTESHLTELYSYFALNMVKVRALLNTPNGYHIITEGFDTKKFNEKFKDSVQKNNPTVLYSNIEQYNKLNEYKMCNCN